MLSAPMVPSYRGQRLWLEYEASCTLSVGVHYPARQISL